MPPHPLPPSRQRRRKTPFRRTKKPHLHLLPFTFSPSPIAADRRSTSGLRGGRGGGEAGAAKEARRIARQTTEDISLISVYPEPPPRPRPSYTKGFLCYALLLRPAVSTTPIPPRPAPPPPPPFLRPWHSSRHLSLQAVAFKPAQGHTHTRALACHSQPRSHTRGRTLAARFMAILPPRWPRHEHARATPHGARSTRLHSPSICHTSAMNPMICCAICWVLYTNCETW